MFNYAGNQDNQGQTYYMAPNADYGATFTYYLKEAPKSKKELRKKPRKAYKGG